MYQKTTGKENSRPNAAADNGEKIAGKGKALPAVSPAQLAAEEEEPMQGKFEPVQKAAEEEEPMQGKFETVQKAAEEEEPMQGKFETVQKAAEEEEPMQGKFETVQKAAEEEEPMQGKFETVQKAAEEEEPMQGKFETVQKAAEEEEPMQGKFETVQKAAEEEEPMQGKFEPVQKAAEEEEPMQGKFEPVQKAAEEEEPMQGKFETVQKAAEEEEPMQGKFETVQKAAEEEEPMQGKFEPVQKAAEEEEPMQGKFETVQKAAEEEEPMQGKFKSAFQLKDQPVQRKEAGAAGGKTGLPGTLKSGIESLSGFSMNDVKVHYNSDKPKQLKAYAYAQGTDIHIAPGQEKHLPHEAWHVAQQKQGRVQPTMQMKKGTPVNDDAGLEHEADVMGAKAASIGAEAVQKKELANGSAGSTAQLRFNGSILSRGVVQRQAVAQRNPELDMPDMPTMTRGRSTGGAPPPPTVTFHRNKTGGQAPPQASAEPSPVMAPASPEGPKTVTFHRNKVAPPVSGTPTPTLAPTTGSAPPTVTFHRTPRPPKPGAVATPQAAPATLPESPEYSGILKMIGNSSKVLSSFDWSTAATADSTALARTGLAGTITSAGGVALNKKTGAKDVGETAIGAAGHVISGVGASITGLVAAVKGIKAAWDEGKAEKATAEGSLAAVSGMLTALKSGFEAAASIQRFISGAVSPAVASTIPGLGLAMAACEVITNAYVAYKSEAAEAAMGEATGNFMSGVVSVLGGQFNENKAVFNEQTRGKRGNRKNYLRINADTAAELEYAKTAPPDQQAIFLARKGFKPGVKFEDAYLALKNFELGSKLTEINQKRKVHGARNIFVGIIKIAGEIAKFFPADGGVTALALVGTAGAMSAGQSIAKMIQGKVRDKGILGGDKTRSKSAKHKEYVNHTRSIYQFLDSMPKPVLASDEGRVRTGMKLIAATGVNDSNVYATDYSNAEAVNAQVNSIVAAMKAGR